MIPIYLNPAHVRVAVIGRGRLAARRVAWLQAAGACPDVWSDAPEAELSAAADVRVRLPLVEELSAYQAVWIADLQRAEAEALAQGARDAGVLVNVEDVIALCDFHTPAVVRRGQLTLAAATGGASPAVARAARERLEQSFPESWGLALDEISGARAALRERGASFDDLVADARARLARHKLV